MPYTKQTWTTGDIISAEKLNHMEDGIEAASEGGGLPAYTIDDVGNTLKLVTTYEETSTTIVPEQTIIFDSAGGKLLANVTGLDLFVGGTKINAIVNDIECEGTVQQGADYVECPISPIPSPSGAVLPVLVLQLVPISPLALGLTSNQSGTFTISASCVTRTPDGAEPAWGPAITSDESDIGKVLKVESGDESTVLFPEQTVDVNNNWTIIDGAAADLFVIGARIQATIDGNVYTGTVDDELYCSFTDAYGLDVYNGNVEFCVQSSSFYGEHTIEAYVVAPGETRLVWTDFYPEVTIEDIGKMLKVVGVEGPVDRWVIPEQTVTLEGGGASVELTASSEAIDLFVEGASCKFTINGFDYTTTVYLNTRTNQLGASVEVSVPYIIYLAESTFYLTTLGSGERTISLSVPAPGIVGAKTEWGASSVVLVNIAHEVRSGGTHIFTFDKTWNEIRNAFLAGRNIIVQTNTSEPDTYPVYEAVRDMGIKQVEGFPDIYFVSLYTFNVYPYSSNYFSTSDPDGYPSWGFA